MSWHKDFTRGDEVVRVALRHIAGRRHAVQVGDTVHEVEAHLLPDGRVRCTMGTEVFDADCAPCGDSLQVRIAGHTWSLRPAKRTGATAVESNGVIEAPMTGTVARVLVREGDAVEAGATVLVLTAMKMEHKLTAGAAGVVAELAAIEGDTVEQGTILARIEAD